MNGRRSRAIAAFGLILVLVLSLMGTAGADPDKDESGKERKTEEQKGRDEGGGSGDNDDAGSGEKGDSDKGDRPDAGDGGDRDADEGSKSSGGSGGDTDGAGDGDGSRDRERRRSTSTSSQPTGGDQQGNIPCTQLLGPGAKELKLQNPSSGSHSDGTLTVNLQRTGEGAFTWTSNIDVDAVIAKGGSNSNVYNLPGTSDLSGSATTPTNPSNNQPFGLSHVSFCYGTGSPPPPPPPPPTDVCPPGSDLAGQPMPGGDVNKCYTKTPPPTDVCPPGSNLAGQPMPGGDIDNCYTPPPSPVCPPGSDLAGQPMPGGDVRNCSRKPPRPGPPDDDVLADLITKGDADGDTVAGTSTTGAEPESREPGVLPVTGASIVAYAALGLLLMTSGILLARRRRAEDV